MTVSGRTSPVDYAAFPEDLVPEMISTADRGNTLVQTSCKDMSFEYLTD